MLKATKKTAIIVVCAIVLAVAVVFATALYPNAKFVFSGITMYDAAGGSTQGFINLTLKDINATSIGFVIEYDETYLEPSKCTDNSGTNVFSEVFKQNTENFPEDSLVYDKSSIILPADTANSKTMGTMVVVIEPNDVDMDGDKSPDKPLSDMGSYIGEVLDNENLTERYIAADGVQDGLDLGELSFIIKKPAELAQKTDAELNDIIHLVSSGGEDIGIEISYYDDENKFAETIAEFKWDVKAALMSVKPAKEQIITIAPDVFNPDHASHEQDLIDFLNTNYRRLLLTWAGGNVTTDNITWDIDKCTISGDAYSIKGGEYEVSQNYNGFTVSVSVTVNPVKLTGFAIDNPYITYAPGSQPNSFADLDLPVFAKPLLDTIVTTRIVPDYDLNIADWNPSDLPADFVAGIEDTYNFDHTIDLTEVEASAPWLTIDDAQDTVTALRTIGDKTDTPDGDTITAEVDDADGHMTITVGQIGGLPIEEGTTFKIKFPDGYILDSEESFVSVTITGGEATIVITPDTSDVIQNALQCMINVDKTGFELSAKAPDKGESDFVPFESDARLNHYTEDITVDYSGGKKNFFKVVPGMDLNTISKHVLLIDNQVLEIAFDGISGQQPSSMDNVHVDSWEIVGDASATNLPDAEGETVTLKGIMTDGYDYDNQGKVYNLSDPPHFVCLIVTISSGEIKPEEEKIKVTTNDTPYYELVLNSETPFVYNTAQQGYASVQTQVFTVHNIGTEDINGLNVQISNTNFVLVSEPDVSIAKKTGKTTFSIRTRTGLPAGEYTAEVTVGSAANSTLETFEIIFKVINDPVYKVTLTVNDPTLGSAVVIGSQTYALDDPVTILAVAATDCEFIEWLTSDVPSINNSSNASETFSMPAQDVTAEAVFKETTAGKLRLEDLKVKTPPNLDNQLLDASDNPIQFDKDTYDYYVKVPYETEVSKLWAKPKNDVVDGVTIVSVMEKAGLNIPCNLDNSDGYYKTGWLNLDEGDNVYTITQSFTDGTSKTYTVTITREKAVTVTWAYGNSPFGLIDGDENLSSADKLTAKNYFMLKYSYDTSAQLPSKVIYTENEKYYPDAWEYKNFDMDSTALFVYSGKAFVDPGFSDLQDSQGNPVDDSAVTRTISVEELQNTAETDIVTKLNNTAELTDPISSGGGTCVINTMQNYNVRPGVYKIVYTFPDPVEGNKSFSRPLIVLYPKGDADIDCDTDEIDYDAIYNRITNNITHNIIRKSDDWCRVYTYRICDVNTDRSVNSIDANRIKVSGGSDKALTEFYEELPEAL